jgi:FMN reductase
VLRSVSDMNRIKVVGLGGSMAETSMSLSALKIALAGAEAAGAEAQLFSIREMNLPIFVPTSRDVPEVARRFLDAAYGAQGLVWCSPTYHAAMSGAFKNALDWLELLRSREPPYLADKIIGLISTAGGTTGLQAINTMEFVVRALRVWGRKWSGLPGNLPTMGLVNMPAHSSRNRSHPKNRT